MHQGWTDGTAASEGESADMSEIEHIAEAEGRGGLNPPAHSLVKSQSKTSTCDINLFYLKIIIRQKS